MYVLSLIPFYLLEREKLLDHPQQKTLFFFSLCFPRTIQVFLKNCPGFPRIIAWDLLDLERSLEACQNIILLELCKHGLRWLLCKVLDTLYECFYLWASPSASLCHVFVPWALPWEYLTCEAYWLSGWLYKALGGPGPALLVERNTTSLPAELE